MKYCFSSKEVRIPYRYIKYSIIDDFPLRRVGVSDYFHLVFAD